MSKVYIFGIGGTGSRVLRSLTMLLAAGVDTSGYDVVPIIIDPDVANADLTRNAELLRLYSSIRDRLTFTEKGVNSFFKTALHTPFRQGYNIPITGTTNLTFKQFIGKSTMSREDEAMAEMLFSEKNLTSTMEVGFKGNPNIGSVVLNQITSTQEFQNFANGFSPGDKIFIISSIFGGTGASGFPLLLKTLRQNGVMPNAGIINQAEIGAITVLPYFSIKQDTQSEIDSSTFFSKTRAALKYYTNNVSSANALYFIGDDPKAQYANSEGGAKQSNDANLIEVLSATAIIDFCNNSFAGQPTSYRELGLNDNPGTVTLQTLPNAMRRAIGYPLMELMLFTKSLVDDYNFVSSSKLSANKKFDEDFYDSQFVQEVRSFLVQYKAWLVELKSNMPSFAPFNVDAELTGLVNDARAKTGLFSGKFDTNYYRSQLNGAVSAEHEDIDRFMAMHCKAAKDTARKKYTF